MCTLCWFSAVKDENLVLLGLDLVPVKEFSLQSGRTYIQYFASKVNV